MLRREVNPRDSPGRWLRSLFGEATTCALGPRASLIVWDHSRGSAAADVPAEEMNGIPGSWSHAGLGQWLGHQTSNDRSIKQAAALMALVHPQKCNPHLGFGSLKMKRTFREGGKKGNKMIGRR